MSSSNIPIPGKALDGTEYADHPPKAMSKEEIAQTISEYESATKNAVEAGFDGVEIHGMLIYIFSFFFHISNYPEKNRVSNI